eukprot:5630586-Alexandrium_andersonii.AAC.1
MHLARLLQGLRQCRGAVASHELHRHPHPELVAHQQRVHEPARHARADRPDTPRMLTEQSEEPTPS